MSTTIDANGAAAEACMGASSYVEGSSLGLPWSIKRQEANYCAVDGLRNS